MAIAGRLSRLVSAALAAGALAGCGTIDHTLKAARDFSPTDFCADLMTRAYREASFEMVDSTSRSSGIAAVTIDLKAHRTDVSPGTNLATDVAVECDFDHGVLVGFRWISGPFN